MRKFKLLPAIFTLVLCVGTLAIGVFALAPTQNTITGTISINSVNTPVQITMNILNKAGGDLIGTPKTIRGGDTFTLGDLAFDSAEANNVYDVKDIFIEFHIKNLAENSDVLTEKQDRTLGAFFAKNTVNLGNDERATSADIFTYEAIKNGEGEDAETLVNIYADSYTPILPQETVKIELQLRMESFEELDKALLNYKLFIEPYVAKETVTEDDGLFKLPVTEAPDTRLTYYTVPVGTTHLAIPATYEYVMGNIKGNCSPFPNALSTLEGVSMPSTYTSEPYIIDCTKITKIVIDTDYLGDCGGCSNLASVTLGNTIEDINYYSFDGCTSLTRIYFEGTMEQWKSISIADNKGNTKTTLKVHGGELRVFCSDGVVDLQTD